jgi:hypothetical protein
MDGPYKGIYPGYSITLHSTACIKKASLPILIEIAIAIGIDQQESLFTDFIQPAG